MNVFARAIDKWGHTAQVTQAMEECGELTAALNHYFFRDKITKEDLAGEVADVELMCRGIREIIGDSIVDKMTKEKVDRLERRLAE
jgi:NTP pyrophosphatase (non-canonical NTP hydrolase)